MDRKWTADASADPVDAALADAIVKAAGAGRFDVVAALSRELEARRLAHTENVVQIERARRSR